MATKVKLPREALSDKEVVILSRSEYAHLKSHQEMAETLVAIAEGEQELIQGDAITASSIAQALEQYAQRPKHP